MAIRRKMNLNGVPSRTVACVAFYNQFRKQISGIRTVSRRNDILSDMQQDFEALVRKDPQNRDKLSEVYQLLKRKCWEAV